MKNNLKFIIGGVVVIALGYWAYTLIKNANQSDRELLNYSIENIDSIDKIIVTDKNGSVFEVKRADSNSEWTDKDGNCVTQEKAEMMLQAFQNLRFKSYLPDNSVAKHKKMTASQNIKVEIFQNGEWTKTWFIGNPTQDSYGQIMSLKTKREGDSKSPVVMKMKGHRGIIDPMFFADPRKWECTEVFTLKLDEIKKVKVQDFEIPKQSFSVTRNGSQFEVLQQGKAVNNVDTSMIFRYLQNYQKIHYNLANYELNQQQVDSMLNTQPFASISVTDKNNVTKKVNCFRIYETIEFEDGRREQQIEKNKFWCELPGKKVVKSQYFVFNPLLLGDIYFPMEK